MTSRYEWKNAHGVYLERSAQEKKKTTSRNDVARETIKSYLYVLDHRIQPQKAHFRISFLLQFERSGSRSYAISLRYNRNSAEAKENSSCDRNYTSVSFYEPRSSNKAPRIISNTFI